MNHLRLFGAVMVLGLGIIALHDGHALLGAGWVAIGFWHLARLQ